jgi:hypothetical protein
MCINYTDLSMHCPKDPFPLPCIVGELGKNLSPSKLRKCQDSKEFMKACREDPSGSVSFVISKKNLLIL